MSRTPHKSPDDWAKVKAKLVVAGSPAQAENVLQMALDDIALFADAEGLLLHCDTLDSCLESFWCVTAEHTDDRLLAEAAQHAVKAIRDIIRSKQRAGDRDTANGAST